MGGLRPVLGRWQLLCVGIGAIIGSGIFVIPGPAAAQFAGPAVIISFIIAALGCALAGLCYAELSAIFPAAGSAYTYTSRAFGRLAGWLIGWLFVLCQGGTRRLCQREREGGAKNGRSVNPDTPLMLPIVKGLGELTPDELASLLETRQRVSEAQYALAEHAWQAFREPTPEALDNLRHTDTAALPYLAAAVARFLKEYPWTTDGLSRTERRFLELAEAGPVELSAAFPRMHDDEDAYYIADTSIAELADALSRTSPPLLTRARGPIAGGELLQGSVTLTDTGRAVLAGEQDRIATCGIDRWLGGVHVQRDADLWRWDDTRQRITKP